MDKIIPKVIDKYNMSQTVTTQMISHMFCEANSFNMEAIEAFDAVWNKYADGNSTKRLIEAVYKEKLED